MIQREKKITLLLGGARSGKSYYAQEQGKKASSVLFVATAEALDEDMQLRIKKHKQDRPENWHTLEATEHVGSRIEDLYDGEDLIIIDCITLLITNIFCQYSEEQFETIQDSILEKQVISEIQELQECLQKIEASFIIVSNEVGLGIVPAFRSGRLFQDILGRANQLLAQTANEVYLMVAGIPLKVKPQS